MDTMTPRFDNLQNELRRELDPRGFLEEEVFRSLVKAAHNRRWETSSIHYYKHDRAFFTALRELQKLQKARQSAPRPVPPAARRRPRPVNVIELPSAA